MIAVLLPGLDGTGELFDLFVAAKPAGVDCIVVRYPPAEQLGYHELTRIAEQALPRGDAILIAESFSGHVALRLARHPSVRAVVLCNSFTSPPRHRWLSVFARSAFFRRPPPRLIVRRFLVGPWAPHQLITAVREAVAKVQPDVLARRLRDLLTTDARDEALDLSKPLLYLRGSEDRLVTERSVKLIEAMIPHVRVRRIAGPHLLLQLAPVECWSAIAGTLLS